MNLPIQFEQPRRRGQPHLWRLAAETLTGFKFLQYTTDQKRCRLLRCTVSVPPDTVLVHAWYGKKHLASVTPTELRRWDIRDRHSKGQSVSETEYSWLKATMTNV